MAIVIFTTEFVCYWKIKSNFEVCVCVCFELCNHNINLPIKHVYIKNCRLVFMYSLNSCPGRPGLGAVFTKIPTTTPTTQTNLYSKCVMCSTVFKINNLFSTRTKWYELLKTNKTQNLAYFFFLFFCQAWYLNTLETSSVWYWDSFYKINYVLVIFSFFFLFNNSMLHYAHICDTGC